MGYCNPEIYSKGAAELTVFERGVFMRKTKIICTMGPAIDHDDLLRDMLQAGMLSCGVRAGGVLAYGVLS